jgi:hypothetical protein
MIFRYVILDVSRAVSSVTVCNSDSNLALAFMDSAVSSFGSDFIAFRTDTRDALSVAEREDSHPTYFAYFLSEDTSVCLKSSFD